MRYPRVKVFELAVVQKGKGWVSIYGGRHTNFVQLLVGTIVLTQIFIHRISQLEFIVYRHGKFLSVLDESTIFLNT